MSLLKSPIDYRSLGEELSKGLEADHTYKLQNDAKIRAVEQNVPTYEHFRQMVNGAHLRPLERTDIKTEHSLSWNPVSNLRKISLSTTKLLTLEQPETNLSRSITTVSSKPCMNFLQVWDNIVDSKEKFLFLWKNRYNLKATFPVEVPTLCVGQFIQVCLEILYSMENATAVVDILTVLSTCNRFNVAVSFLEAQEKDICSQLFQQLLVIVKSQHESLENTVKALAVKYYVALD